MVLLSQTCPSGCSCEQLSGQHLSDSGGLPSSATQLGAVLSRVALSPACSAGIPQLGLSLTPLSTRSCNPRAVCSVPVPKREELN